MIQDDRELNLFIYFNIYLEYETSPPTPLDVNQESDQPQYHELNRGGQALKYKDYV